MLRLTALGFALAVVVVILVGMEDSRVWRDSARELPADIRALASEIGR